MNDVRKNLIKLFRVDPKKRLRLKDCDPGWRGEGRRSKKAQKALAEQWLDESRDALSEMQDRLYAANSWAVLVIFQALDAAGKDSTIKHVMSGINPQGCQVYSFKSPSSEELQHDFLWRCAKVLPERGRIGIFNRSYYEEVLVVRVHPQLLAAEGLPQHKHGADFWEQRYEDINGFEKHLTRTGTKIIKFFLNVSKEEQRRRFLERLENPSKHWKFSASDLKERECWDDYMRAYEEMLNATSTAHAPWYVIPADHKWVMRTAVATIIASEIAELDVDYPEVARPQQQAIEEARRRLADER